jgi:RHS repeat-associated protein
VYRYYPHGEAFSGNPGATGPGFATYERDQHAGLDQAWNRAYLSTYGRFAQPDPYQASGGAAEPGSWNRYRYVQGDPVNYYDPQGLQALPVCPGGDCQDEAPGAIPTIFFCRLFPEHPMCVTIPVSQTPTWEERPLAVKLSQTKALLARIVESFPDDCINLLATVTKSGGPTSAKGGSPLSLTRQSLKSTFGNMELRILSETLNPRAIELWKNTSDAAYDAALRRLGERKLSDLLDFRAAEAASEYYGSLIYVTPGSSVLTLNQLASLLVHEALHLMGYGHGQDTGFPFTFDDIDEKCLKPLNIKP